MGCSCGMSGIAISGYVASAPRIEGAIANFSVPDCMIFDRDVSSTMISPHKPVFGARDLLSPTR